MNNNFCLISGRSNLDLSKKIADHIQTELTECEIRDFANQEIRVQIKENVRGKNVYIIATGTSSEELSINDFIMETMLLIRSAKLSSAKNITLILPFMPYSRSDKKDDGRTAIGGKLLIDFLEVSGVNRIVSMDLHAGQIQGFTNLPFDNLYAINLFIDYLRDRFILCTRNDFVLVSPDNGGAKRIEAYAKKLQMKFVIMHKQRDYSTVNTVCKSTLIGDKEYCQGKTGILIDDMADTMGTMISACQELKEYGIEKVLIIVTHGILSGPAIDRINNCQQICKVVVTNSLPQEKNIERCKKLEVVDTSELFYKVINCLETGNSISSIFN